jgi:hypothetical protein
LRGAVVALRRLLAPGFSSKVGRAGGRGGVLIVGFDMKAFALGGLEDRGRGGGAI